MRASPWTLAAFAGLLTTDAAGTAGTVAGVGAGVEVIGLARTATAVAVAPIVVMRMTNSFAAVGV